VLKERNTEELKRMLFSCESVVDSCELTIKETLEFIELLKEELKRRGEL
jgi:hypothetical protein